MLTDVDKKILRVLLTPDGRHTSQSIARKLKIPLSTILRHRAKLEKELLKNTYILDLHKLGWHRVDFFIETVNGKTDKVATELMINDNMTYVAKSIGEHTIDIRCESIVKDNGCILKLQEEIKAMDGVREVLWSEIVDIVSQKTTVPLSIIDQC